MPICLATPYSGSRALFALFLSNYKSSILCLNGRVKKVNSEVSFKCETKHCWLMWHS